MATKRDRVAHDFPARRDPDGRTWYRSGSGAQDGWTDNLAYAHPSYRAADAPAPLAPGPAPAEPTNAAPAAQPPKETAVTDLALPEPMTRTTRWMGFPLPPPTPRPPSVFGQYGWYRLPDPDTGRPTGYPRATTISGTLEETYGLNKWKRRETANRVLQLARMDPATVLFTDASGDTTAKDILGSLDDALKSGKVGVIDDALDTLDNVGGGAEARELGECVHAWLEAIDMGLVLVKDVPEVVKPHVHHARRVLRSYGLIALPEYVERTVLNDRGEESVAGKIDRIFKIATTGELVLGDVKTSKELKYSWLGFGVQVGGVYGWATKMLNDAGDGWVDMPPIRQDFAILLHVPSNAPSNACAVTIDMWWGGEVMAESLAVRRYQKEAPKVVPAHAIPAPSDAALRYVEARMALSEITTTEDGQTVYETYADVWDDALGEYGSTIAELL